MKFLNIVGKYYRVQTLIDVGWREFSWFNNSLIELMAVVYLLEKLGFIIEGDLIFYILIGAFIFFFLFGLLLKKTKIYDKSMYVDADIDPVKKEILEAARRINQARIK